MLTPDGVGFLVILLSRLRQTPQSENTKRFHAFFVRTYNSNKTTNYPTKPNYYYGNNRKNNESPSTGIY